MIIVIPERYMHLIWFQRVPHFKSRPSPETRLAIKGYRNLRFACGFLLFSMALANTFVPIQQVQSNRGNQ